MKRIVIPIHHQRGNEKGIFICVVLPALTEFVRIQDPRILYRWCKGYFCQYSKIILISFVYDYFRLVSFEETLSGIFEYVCAGKRTTQYRLKKLPRILWAGNVDEALAYLQSIDTAILHPANCIDDLYRYIEKHWDHIPPYALRTELGLRNSSNRVEKANDLVIADRSIMA